jgi:hypothetical protein
MTKLEVLLKCIPESPFKEQLKEEIAKVRDDTLEEIAIEADTYAYDFGSGEIRAMKDRK